MRAIPLTARERIIHLYDQGQSTREIAEFLGFCVAAVRRVRQQFKVRGSLKPQTHLCGRKTLLTAERKASLQKWVQAQPDATLAELGARWDRPFGTSTVDLWVRRLGLTYKKTLFAAEQNRPDGAEKRAHWHEQLAGDPVGRLVFVDESGANTQMTRLRGRSPLGQCGRRRGQDANRAVENGSGLLVAVLARKCSRIGRALPKGAGFCISIHEPVAVYSAKVLSIMNDLRLSIASEGRFQYTNRSSR